MLLADAHCYQHPQRLGIGICVECRQVICAECSTQFDGINRCARCLAKLAPKSAEAKPYAEWGVLSWLGAAACFAGLYASTLALAAWAAP